MVANFGKHVRNWLSLAECSTSTPLRKHHTRPEKNVANWSRMKRGRHLLGTFGFRGNFEDVSNDVEVTHMRPVPG